MRQKKRIEKLEKRESSILGKVFEQMTDEELEVIAYNDDWESVKPVHDRYLQLWREAVKNYEQNQTRPT